MAHSGGISRTKTSHICAPCMTYVIPGDHTQDRRIIVYCFGDDAAFMEHWKVRGSCRQWRVVRLRRGRTHLVIVPGGYPGTRVPGYPGSVTVTVRVTVTVSPLCGVPGYGYFPIINPGGLPVTCLVQRPVPPVAGKMVAVPGMII
jgi:hypothetical protein